MWKASAPGLALLGSGVAFPSDCAAIAPLDNAAAYRALLGAASEHILAERGWASDHPERVWGIRSREWSRLPGCAPACDAADIGLAAGRAALRDAGVRPEEIDVLAVATSTPPRVTSSLAGRLARTLGIEGMAFDVRAGGAGGLQAWALASRLLAHPGATALVVAAAVPSHYLDPTDLVSSLLYGDGAGALVLRRLPDAAGGLVFAAAGNAAYEGTAFTVPQPLPPVSDEPYRFQRPDAAYGRHLAATWSLATEVLADQVDPGVPTHLVPYAVTRERTEGVAARLGCSAATGLDVLAHHGVLGSAGPLVAVAKLRARGAVAATDALAGVAVGGGIAWCSLLWRS